MDAAYVAALRRFHSTCRLDSGCETCAVLLLLADAERKLVESQGTIVGTTSPGGHDA